MQQLPADIQVIDTLHVGKTGTIACYADLQGAVVLVDPGPQVSFAEVHRQLAARGAHMADVAAILLTHIHLDHAGAVGSIVRDYPHIQVYVHERGAPHLIDPSRLLRSATRIYGGLMDALWGEFLPVPAANLHVLQGGEVLDVAGRAYQVLYTPGHAVHHVTYVRACDGVTFIGDTAGIRMQGYHYIRPATPPPDIDLALWDASVAAITAVQPQALCLTHFGPVFDVDDHLSRMQVSNWRWAEYVRDWRRQDWTEEQQIAELRRIATAEMGVDATPEGIAAYQKGASIEMSWQGLSRFWQQKELA